MIVVITLVTQDNAKLLQQLKSGFKTTNNWNKYQSKVTMQAPNPYLNYIVDPSFQGVNRPFVLLFENTTARAVHTKYYLPTLEIKSCNVMIDGKTFLNQPVKHDSRTYDNIGKIATGPGDNYTTSCRLDYDCFNKYYKMIATDLTKQQALHVDPKALQQINFTGIFFNIEEAKKTLSNFWQRTVRIL